MGRKGYCLDPFRLHKNRMFRSIVSVSSELAGTYGMKKGEKVCTNCRNQLAEVKGQPGPSQTQSSTSSSSECMMHECNVCPGVNGVKVS